VTGPASPASGAAGRTSDRGIYRESSATMREVAHEAGEIVAWMFIRLPANLVVVWTAVTPHPCDW
jgi:hypothetical protein